MTSNQLVADIYAARQGDAVAWERLLETYRPVLETWALAFSSNGDLSHSDLVQEAWLYVWKGLDSFKGVEDPEHVTPMFYRWLKITARNAMLTRIKHRQAKRRFPDCPVVSDVDQPIEDDGANTPSSIVSHKEETMRMRAAVDRLSDPLDRQIINMVTEDGLSLRVVSSVLGRDYSTIRRKFHNVLGRLEQILNPP